MPSKFKKVAVLRHKKTVNNTTEADAVRQRRARPGWRRPGSGGCLPTTYSEMFAFNAAVMGFDDRKWMKVLDSFHTIVTNVSNSALFARGVCHLRRTTTSPTCWRPCEPSSRRPLFFSVPDHPHPHPHRHKRRNADHQHTHTNTHLQCTHERTFKTQTGTNTHHSHTRNTAQSVNSRSESSHACRSVLASRAAPVWWSWSWCCTSCCILCCFCISFCAGWWSVRYAC